MMEIKKPEYDKEMERNGCAIRQGWDRKENTCSKEGIEWNKREERIDYLRNYLY